MMREVEQFLVRSGMSPSRFGRDFNGDPRLVFQMREGRTPRPAMVKRIRQFIAERGTPAESERQ